MRSDPIVQEVREARTRLAERFGHNLEAIVKHIQKRERESGHRIVSRPRKPTEA